MVVVCAVVVVSVVVVGAVVVVSVVVGVRGERARLAVSPTTLDGRELGTVEVARGGREFSALDEAILTHLAQMASAAVERVRLYAA